MKNNIFIVSQKGVYIYNQKQIVNAKYINQSSMTMKCDVNTKEIPCKLTPDISYFVTTELTRPYLLFQGTNMESNQTFVQQFVNMCSMPINPLGMNIFMKLLLDQLRKSINFTFNCPYKKVRLWVQILSQSHIWYSSGSLHHQKLSNIPWFRFGN